LRPRRCQKRKLRQTRLIHPDYSDKFRCIGSACEDTCCKGWGVPIDHAAYEKYRNLPPSALRSLIQINCLITTEGAGGRMATGKAGSGAVFAKIRMTSANQCPLLSDAGLCRIQKEYGATFLPRTCATYPRIVRSVDGTEETALVLSCPEAARLVLLNPSLLSSLQHDLRNQTPADSFSDQVGGCDSRGHAHSLLPWFWPIRESVLALLGNRAYPIWQRLFLLGIFCRQLDAIATGDLHVSVGAFLHDFEDSIASGILLPGMEAVESLPLDLTLQVDAVLRLAGMLLQHANVLPRFVECVSAFTAGIGNSPDATLESLTAHYALAHDRFYAPFFDEHPHILENYLANAILGCQFPFPEPIRLVTSTSLAGEYARLTARFALMKGLLIGVSGYYGESFSTEHVVHTVQAASKHFEHHPDFLSHAHALLVERQMDDVRGLAILIRNRASTVFRAASSDAPYSRAKAS
jgi:lysine-N-methylase